MTDAELLAKASAARGLAHRAPMAEVYAENELGRPTGKLKIRDHTRAYADRSNEFFDVMKEVDKRGLKMPACDCPAGSHDN